MLSAPAYRNTREAGVEASCRDGGKPGPNAFTGVARASPILPAGQIS